MIKYKLVCKDCNISFESWFSSSVEYEKLKKKKLLNCHICNSLKIKKSLMAPSVIRSKNDIVIKTNDKDLKDIKKKLTETQKFIKKNFNYVGENFAYKAREIHYQNKKNLQGIYGLATKEEFKELKEEGIEAEIIPWIKDKAN